MSFRFEEIARDDAPCHSFEARARLEAYDSMAGGMTRRNNQAADKLPVLTIDGVSDRDRCHSPSSERKESQTAAARTNGGEEKQSAEAAYSSREEKRAIREYMEKQRAEAKEAWKNLSPDEKRAIREYMAKQRAEAKEAWKNLSPEERRAIREYMARQRAGDG